MLAVACPFAGSVYLRSCVRTNNRFLGDRKNRKNEFQDRIRAEWQAVTNPEAVKCWPLAVKWALRSHEQLHLYNWVRLGKLARTAPCTDYPVFGMGVSPCLELSRSFKCQRLLFCQLQLLHLVLYNNVNAKTRCCCL